VSGWLLDTHTLLWAAHRPDKLSAKVISILEDVEKDVFVSPVSAIEIATKNRRGQLEFTTGLAHDFLLQVSAHGFTHLPVTASHAQLAGSFAQPHKDPWDRLLAAQAILEELTLLTRDDKVAAFGAITFW
jgi:PIN domain nuclease of toxin-antitoxin system